MSSFSEILRLAYSWLLKTSVNSLMSQYELSICNHGFISSIFSTTSVSSAEKERLCYWSTVNNNVGFENSKSGVNIDNIKKQGHLGSGK
uniref:SCP domain-containing protein n=1 Tax=Strongyloides papillosus TaxID=174720 RepID=A0A0N5CIN2_STREA